MDRDWRRTTASSCRPATSAGLGRRPRRAAPSSRAAEMRRERKDSVRITGRRETSRTMLASACGGTSGHRPASGQIRSGQYVVPFHAASELDDDDLSVSTSRMSSSPAISSRGSAIRRPMSESTSSKGIPSRAKRPAASSSLVDRAGHPHHHRASRTTRRCDMCGREGALVRRVTGVSARGRVSGSSRISPTCSVPPAASATSPPARCAKSSASKPQDRLDRRRSIPIGPWVPREALTANYAPQWPGCGAR